MAIEAEGRHCTHCREVAAHTRSHRAVPTAREPLDQLSSPSDLDEISEDERWLWRLVDEAERVAAAAPPAADPQQVTETEQRYALVRQAEERVLNRIRVTEGALARFGSWLRPAHRAALARHLREDRSAAVATAVQRGRIEEALSRLRATTNARAGYLNEHRTVLSAGLNARAELERIFDDLIDGYARLTNPPAWFRFGLGFPPPPGAQPQWLATARETLAQRRRLTLEHPKW
jgi:hypothetical protein